MSRRWRTPKKGRLDGWFIEIYDDAIILTPRGDKMSICNNYLTRREGESAPSLTSPQIRLAPGEPIWIQGDQWDSAIEELAP